MGWIRIQHITQRVESGNENMTDLEQLLEDIKKQVSEKCFLTDENKLYTIERMMKNYHSGSSEKQGRRSKRNYSVDEYIKLGEAVEGMFSEGCEFCSDGANNEPLIEGRLRIVWDKLQVENEIDVEINLCPICGRKL